jgi:HTH-type transcriptional regulator / antitoxin HigA
MATSLHDRWRPDWAIAPGEILLETLDERGMSQAELARRMNRPLKTINEIIKGKSAITPETALQLELVLDIPASFWNNLERNYREQLAREEAEQGLQQETDWIKRFPIKQLVKYKVLKGTTFGGEQVKELLRFFGVSSPAAWSRYWTNAAVSFRQSPAFAVSPEAVAVWLRWGEIRANEIECQPFDARKVELALPDIRRLSRKMPLGFREPLVDILRQCGVALVLTPEFPGTHLSGATRWLSPTKVLVQLSLRHRSDDQFWFTLFHELGHVLFGSKRQAYLDLEQQPSTLFNEELEADEFAANYLIPPAEYRTMVEATELTKDLIEQTAERVGVSEGIIVGRLQRDRPADAARFSYLKQRYQWSDEA